MINRGQDGMVIAGAVSEGCSKERQWFVVPSRPVAVAIGRQWILLFLLLIGISKAVVLLGLRLRSPPVASGRLRLPPVTSSRPRSPSTSAMGLGLVQVVPGGVSVGRGALFQCTNAFFGD